MRVAKIMIASCILAVGSAHAASAQFVDPLRVLEASRRDRLELDKRIAREAAAQRQKAAQAAQANAQRKLDQERAASANSASTGVTLASQLAASSAPEPVPGAPTPAASPVNAGDGAPAPTPPVASSVRAETVLPPGSAPDTANGGPLSNQPGAPSVHEVVPGAPVPATPASSAGSETPATNQPMAPSAAEAVVGPPIPTPPRVLITVDKAAQRMRVTVDGKLRYSWPVSTGRVHYETPSGSFRPLWLAKVHYSKEWDDAPMPHSIFFTDQGHAIHATNATRSLGRRASHGCVRLAPAKAAALFALVRAEGQSTTRVTITNGTAREKAVRSRAADLRARKRAHARRTFSDS